MQCIRIARWGESWIVERISTIAEFGDANWSFSERNEAN
jgi:hypothetical protein